MNAAVVTFGSSGSQTNALAFGGENPGPTGNTEEWYGNGIITETVD